MVFKATPALAAPSALPDIELPLNDTQALLQAALRASWQRDRSVGRRRRVMRWIMWWSWKYLLPVVVICGVITAVIDQLAQRGYLQPWLPAAPLIALPSFTDTPAAPVSQAAPHVVAPPSSTQDAVPALAPASGLPLQLDMQLQMPPRAARSAVTDDAAASSNTPITLQNTTQLKPQEPSR